MDTFLRACSAGVNDVGRGFCSHAGSVFIQSGALIVILLGVDLLLRRRVRATVRYWIWMLVIIKLLLPPTFSLPTGIGHWLGEYTALPSLVGRQALEAAGSHKNPGQAVSPETPIPASNAGVEAAMTDPLESAAGPGERLTWQGGVVLLWGVGVLAFVVLVIRRVLFVRRLVAQGHPARGEPVALLEECRRRMKIRRPVEMKLLSGSFSPAVCGLRRPTILLPEALPTRLAPDNLRAVLVHELAHVKRGDLWVNCVQTILQVIHFYNPLVWLANAIVRRVREQAVDEMSLVALGAEARSYGHTLIDIAEMAFWRASPALRLVGVAESKKSLEGRIRHMITRPIPKSARMGVARGLVVAALGAVLLPMAAAGTKMIGRPPFTATLPNGVTVELVGVCNWPAGAPVCWRADGSPLEKPLHVTKWRTRPGANHYGFMVRIAGPNDLNRSWDRIEGSDGWEAGCDVVDAQGNRLEGYTAAVALVKEGAAQTALRLGFATGPWSTISTDRGQGMSSRRHTDVLWSQMFQDPRGTFVVATTEWRRERTRRIIAIDAEGAMHVGRGGSVATGTMDQATYYFPHLRPDQIKELQYQVRPFEWVEFEGVSLVSGQRTEVRAHADSGARTDGGTDGYTTYQVNRRVADFPPGEDLSTPEAAYATINRIPMGDAPAWQKVSVAKLAHRLAAESNSRKIGADPEWAKVLANACILRVVIWNNTQAAALAELPQALSSKTIVGPIDVRFLELKNGRWFNAGNGRYLTVEEATAQFLARCQAERRDE